MYFCLKICIYAIFVVPLHDFCYTADKAAMKTWENNLKTTYNYVKSITYDSRRLGNRKQI